MKLPKKHVLKNWPKEFFTLSSYVFYINLLMGNNTWFWVVFDLKAQQNLGFLLHWSFFCFVFGVVDDSEVFFQLIISFDDAFWKSSKTFDKARLCGNENINLIGWSLVLILWSKHDFKTIYSSFWVLKTFWLLKLSNQNSSQNSFHFRIHFKSWPHELHFHDKHQNHLIQSTKYLNIHFI